MRTPSPARFACRFALAAIASVALAEPAHAESLVKLPEPSGAALLALGLAGVLLGRHLAGKRED